MKTTLLVLTLTTGCATTAIYDPRTGERLDSETPALERDDTPIVISRFVLLEQQDFDHQKDDRYRYWKEARGIADLTWRISERLSSRGFTHVSDNPTDAAQLYVTGRIAQPSRPTDVESYWNFIGGALQLATLSIVPMYFTATGKSEVVVEIRDQTGQLLAEHKASIEVVQRSGYRLALLNSPSLKAIADAAAGETAAAILALRP